ncbi:MAG: hypothetical protein VB099_20595 [Candidatus Limiplasma sp.]|nr:hypothetical protein [Candidatus Limiplasma sp.]
MDKRSYPITIKIRAEGGCFCRRHSPVTNGLIDEIINLKKDHKIDYHEHESGPEVIAWLALGTAGLALTKSIVDLVTAIVNACKKGREKGDNHKGKLVLIIRDTQRTEMSTEEIVLEIYDRDIVTTEAIEKALQKGINRKHNKVK